jgi:chemotaxis protein MotB
MLFAHVGTAQHSEVDMNLKRSSLMIPALAPIFLSGCVVWKSDYDALAQKNQQLEQQVSASNAQRAADRAQIARLQGAIKYTVNSDLLFPSGSWQMSDAGKQVIAKMAPQLAPFQQSKVLVNGYTDNAPIGRSLERQGVTSNQILSQKRAEAVMAYLATQGVKPDMMSAHGFGDAQPVASNDTAAGRAQNRRVELTLAAPPAG